MIVKLFKSAPIPVIVLLVFIISGVLAPLLSGEKPLCARTNDKKEERQTKEPIFYFYPLVPYGPQMIDSSFKKAVPPLTLKEGNSKRYTHWLGTDKYGRDVLAGIIHGSRTAIMIGFVSVLLAFLIGVPLGMASGYFGDSGIRAGWVSILTFVITFPVALFYIITESRQSHPDFLITGLIMLMLVGLNVMASKIRSKKWHIPLDMLLIHIIALRKSFPGIFLLLVLASLILKPSVWNVIGIIAVLGWADFARLARAETLAVKEENYIANVTMIGLGAWRIGWRHIFPNIWSTLLVATCFSIGGAILLEATLSFLGVGLPVEQVTWGKMLADGRDMKAWWLVVSPGLCIFAIIWSLHGIADVLQDKQKGIFRT
jgi:peptide/nickel transport system permease protein